MAMLYKFNLSTYVQEPLVIGRRGCTGRDLGPLHTIRHVSVPSSFPLHSVRLICVHTVVFSHLPAQHVIRGPRLLPQIMQPHSFSKRQLAAIVLILDEEEKNAALSDKKKSM